MNKIQSLFCKASATHDLDKSFRTAALFSAILAGFFPTPTRAEGVAVQWEKTHNGRGNGDEVSLDVAVDSVGNVVVTGDPQNISGDYELYVAKYAAESGSLLWERRHGPGWGKKLAVDRADNVIVLGALQGNDYGTDYFTAKYAANGVLLWQKRYNGIYNKNDDASALALDDAGNVIVTGTSESESSGDDIYTAKYAAADGRLIWEHRYDRPEPVRNRDHGHDVAADRDGNAIVTGFIRSSLGLDFYVMKLAAADGVLIWNTLSQIPRIRGSGGSVAVDREGNAIATGYCFISPEDPWQNYYTAKYAAGDGRVVWEVIYKGPGDGNDSASKVRVDGEGNAIVTGRSVDNGNVSEESYADIYTAKYAAADGTLLWEQRYNGPGNGWDTANGLILDNAGNAIVTGNSTGIGGSRDFFTAKYAAADGALLWEKRYKGAGNAGGASVAVDLHNCTIVSGGVIGASGNSDLYTAKYVETDADNDGLLDSWEVTHFGSTAGQSALDDTDHDGAVELLELAFGTNPRAPDSVPAPVVVVECVYLTITIIKQPCVLYVVETSATLESGFSAASTTVLTDTASILKVRDNVLIGDQPQRFLRVKVTTAP